MAGVFPVERALRGGRFSPARVASGVPRPRDVPAEESQQTL